MDKLKVLWLIIILGNIFDYVMTLLFSYFGILYMDYNILIGYNTNFTNVLLTLTGEKLLFLSGVYWFSKLFDYLKISKYKWIGLLPFTIITTIVVVRDLIGLIIYFLYYL